MLFEISDSEIKWFRKKIIFWGKDNFADFPWRSVTNNWHALVAEIMLQRTKAEQVVPVFQSFAAKYPTPADYAQDEKATAFASLGLAWREKWLRELASTLKNIEIPQDKESLLKLPGIGEYISSAYRSMHLGICDSIIDANIVRLYGRFFGFETDGETRRKKWFIELANRMMPKKGFKDFNYALLDFTREICKPKPMCSICTLKSRCHYFQQIDN